MIGQAGQGYGGAEAGQRRAGQRVDGAGRGGGGRMGWADDDDLSLACFSCLTSNEYV